MKKILLVALLSMQVVSTPVSSMNMSFNDANNALTQDVMATLKSKQNVGSGKGRTWGMYTLLCLAAVLGTAGTIQIVKPELFTDARNLAVNVSIPANVSATVSEVGSQVSSHGHAAFESVKSVVSKVELKTYFGDYMRAVEEAAKVKAAAEAAKVKAAAEAAKPGYVYDAFVNGNNPVAQGRDYLSNGFLSLLGLSGQTTK